MKHKKLVSHKQKLDALFEKTKALEADAELVSHWCRYLCVLVSGFVEASTRTLILDYASARSTPQISNFVRKRVEHFSNAKMNKILELVNDFSPDHKATLARAVEGEIKDGVDSVVSNRHLISHGQDVGIGLASVKKYYACAIKAVEELETIFST